MLQRLILIFIVNVLFLSVAIAQTDLNKNYSLSISDNYRIYPSNVTQVEVFIVNHPSNPDIMFSSANTYNFSPFFISEGIYVTTDGGVNWRGSDTCTGAILDLHGGDPGIAIDKDGTFIITRLGFTPGLFSHYSTNNGLTWSSQKLISNDDLERATLTTDGTPSSSYYGRTYAVWVKFTIPFRIASTYTNNGGQSWSTPIPINNPTQRSGGGEIGMGLNGKVYVCWVGLTELPSSFEDFVGVASSSDGGDNWIADENAFDMNGIAGQLIEKSNIRVNGLPSIAVDTSGGSRNGWVYIVTAQKNLLPAGSDPDIILNRSTDDGITWSDGIRVNQDQLNNGKIQFFPAIHVDKDGGINIIFYDDRNTTSDSTGVFLARSENGGENWREFEISDHNFKPTPIAVAGGKMGDNIDITSSNGKLWPVWMDNSTGIYQIWTVPIEISTVDVDERDDTFINSFQLEQNYPNPFNPATNIKFRIAEFGFVILKIYDVLGNEVATLVNEAKSAGEYEVIFNGDGLPSGIYLCRLTTGSLAETRKMLLLK
jgi:hypothetical protein